MSEYVPPLTATTTSPAARRTPEPIAASRNVMSGLGEPTRKRVCGRQPAQDGADGRARRGAPRGPGTRERAGVRAGDDGGRTGPVLRRAADLGRRAAADE